MKQKYVTLKMYVIGVTVGLFLWGWSAVSHPVASSVSTTGSTVNTSIVQTQSTNALTISNQPRIRTRTS